jgi:Zn-dependent protease
MTLQSWPVPFIITPQNMAVDAITAFVVSVLLAITINAEAQAFAGTFLGDARKDVKDRFHFNAFLHVGILGSICYLLGGFGWPRTLDLDRSKFKHPHLYTVIARAAGPLANLLLAGIGGSVVMIMKSFHWDPRVFLMVVGVNITTAIYSLLPLPPLAGGFLVCELLPADWVKARSIFLQAGPFVIVALVLLDRLNSPGVLSQTFNPMIQAVFTYIKG